MELSKPTQLECEKYMPREQIEGTEDRHEYIISEISVLHELGRAIINVHDFKKLCGQMLDVIIKNTKAQDCSIMFLDRRKESLYLICSTKHDEQAYIIDPKKVFSKEGVIYSPDADKGAAGKAVRINRPVLIENTDDPGSFPEHRESPAGIKSLLSVPMEMDGRVKGVIILSHPEPQVFNKNDINLFRIIL